MKQRLRQLAWMGVWLASQTPLAAADPSALSLEERATRFLHLVNAGHEALSRVENEAQWKAATDVTPAHDAAAEVAGKARAAFTGNPALIQEARALLGSSECPPFARHGPRRMARTRLAGQSRGEAGVPCNVCRSSEVRMSTGSGWLFSARPAQAELKRIWPKGGRSGGRRAVRKPSQRARAKPCSVARRAQS